MGDEGEKEDDIESLPMDVLVVSETTTERD